MILKQNSQVWDQCKTICYSLICNVSNAWVQQNNQFKKKGLSLRNPTMKDKRLKVPCSFDKITSEMLKDCKKQNKVPKLSHWHRCMEIINQLKNCFHRKTKSINWQMRQNRGSKILFHRLHISPSLKFFHSPFSLLKEVKVKPVT